jgi:hypothetical protein
VEIVGCGGNGVIDAPSAGIDLAKHIATGETSALLERLRMTRFEKSDGASA